MFLTFKNTNPSCYSIVIAFTKNHSGQNTMLHKYFLSFVVERSIRFSDLLNNYKLEICPGRWSLIALVSVRTG